MKRKSINTGDPLTMQGLVAPTPAHPQPQSKFCIQLFTSQKFKYAHGAQGNWLQDPHRCQNTQMPKSPV